MPIYTAGSVQDDYVSSAYGVTIQPDGKILSFGRDNYYFRITRLSANGVVEANWEYTAVYGYGRAIAVKDDVTTYSTGRYIRASRIPASVS